MTANINSPYPYFTDTRGNPLEGGQIYIGTAGLDPRTNPVAVFQDAALTIPWNPICTVGGYPAYQGAPSNMYVNAATFSIIVASSAGEIVFRDLNASGIIDAETLASTSGASLVGFPGFNGASNVDEALDWLRTSVNVLEFGAVGDGVTDDRTAIQAAIDYAFANDMDVVFPANIPAYYKISLNLVCRPGVSMRGVGGKAKIKNMNSAGATLMDRSVFLMGNMALNFTQLLTSYDCGTILAGNSVTLTTIGDAANFAVGDQVVTLSTATSTSSGFTLNDYLHLNRITAIAGAVITLQYPIDVSYAGGIAKLSSVSTTTAAIVLPMYFIDNCTFENLDIEAPGGGMFNGYGGMYNVAVRDCISDGAWGPYGNTMQHCKFVNNQWYFSRLMGEFALNSLASIHSGSSFCYKQNSALFPAPEARFQFSEATRNCEFTDNAVNVNRLAVTAGFSLFAFSGGVQNMVSQNTIVGDNAASALTIVSFVGQTTGLRSTRNSFTRNNVQMNRVRLFANFATVDSSNTGNSFEDNILAASSGDFAYSVLLSNSYGNYIRRNESNFGAILFNDTVSSGNIIDDNDFPAGFGTNETSANEQYYQQNVLRNNASDASVVKQGLVLSSFSSVSAPASTATTVYSENIGTSMAARDRYEFEFYIQPTGAGATKPIVFNLRNVTDSTDIALFSHTIPAASTGLVVVKTTVVVKGAGATAATTTTVYDTTAGTTTTYASTFARPAIDKDLSFNLIATPGAGVSLSFVQITANYSNPYN